MTFLKIYKAPRNSISSPRSKGEKLGFRAFPIVKPAATWISRELSIKSSESVGCKKCPYMFIKHSIKIRFFLGVAGNMKDTIDISFVIFSP